MMSDLSDAIATLRHRYGAAAVHLGGHDRESTWPTGMPAIDERLTLGGLPPGRLTVLSAGHGGATGRLTILQALAAGASRSMDVAYVDLMGTLDPGFLADLGADLGACLVVTPTRWRWGQGLAMARALVGAGVPWLGIALDNEAPRAELWDHALSALGAAVWKARTVCVIASPSPLPLPLAYASSLTLACAATGWHEAHGDVVGLRVGLTVLKSRLGAGSGRASVLLRYPRPSVAGEVISTPMLVPVPITPEGEEFLEPVAGRHSAA